ncbi:MAG: hypothetical protein P8165_19710, partial [Deltaproteobacteria bacterium]
HQAKRTNKCKFLAFWWKCQESLGWSLCFSLLAAPIGIPIVLFSQLIAIIHSIQQNAERLTGVMTKSESLGILDVAGYRE